MKTVTLILLVLFLGLFSVRADDNSVALEKLRKIPTAPATLSWEQQSKVTPMLVVTSRGVIINHSKTPVPFNQVLKALADLPKEAWPYGRAILYFDSPPGLSNPEDQPLQSDAKKVEADLKAAGIQLEHEASR